MDEFTSSATGYSYSNLNMPESWEVYSELVAFRSSHEEHRP